MFKDAVRGVVMAGVMGLILAACGQAGTQVGEDPGTIGLANPASTYCVGLGNALELREEAAGQYGVCIFPDGSECEEWDFLAGRCAPEETFCAQQGYRLEPGSNIGTCRFPDGTSCLEIDFFQGQCGPGSSESETTPGEGSDSVSSTGGVAVAGWMGAVYTLPEGERYDDFVSLAPEGTGMFGVAGSTPEMDAALVELRDHPEPGKYANFWGTLTCGVDDHAGCRLSVDRIRVGSTESDPEAVEGWRGTIVSLDPASGQFDDAFVLDGPYPVRFGIAPAIGVDGELIGVQALEAQRDSGIPLHVWGLLRCGVPDVNACQIQVERFETVAE